MTTFGIAILAVALAAFWAWCLCRAAALADRRTEHELQGAPHGTDAAPNAAAGDLAPGSSAPRVVPLTHYTRERRRR